MNYLLDTTSFISAIAESKELSVPVRRLIKSNGNNIFVSAVTFWEIAWKVSEGKLDVEGVLIEDLPDISLQVGFKSISLSPAECATYHQFGVAGQNPFEVMLIWQAIKNDLILITKDKESARYRSVGLKTVW